MAVPLQQQQQQQQQQLQQRDNNFDMETPPTSTPPITQKLRFDDNVKVSQFDDAAFEDDFAKASNSITCPDQPESDGGNYAEIDVINDGDFFYLTNLNHYYQERRLHALQQLQQHHDYYNVPIVLPQTKSTSTSPWHESKSKCRIKLKSLQLLRKPRKWKLKRTLDEIVKCLIIASSEHVYNYDVLW